MRHLRPLIVSLVCLIAAPAAAQPFDEARDRLEASSGAALRGIVDGPTRVLRGFDVALPAASPESTATRFVEEFGPAIGIDAGNGADWIPVGRSPWRGRTLVRLQQHHRGVPVLGGRLVVRLEEGSRVTLASASVHDGLRVDVTPVVAESEAISAARRVLELGADAPALATLAVAPTASGGVLVHRVRVSTDTPHGSWLVTVDAVSGAVRRISDVRRHAQGNVYWFSPDDGEPIEVELTDLGGDATVMSGTYARVRSMVVDGDDVGEEHLAVADDQGDFLYEPENSVSDPFVEVHVYHHVTELSHWFEDRLGHPFDGPALVTTNYTYEDGSGYDNAFYSQDYSGNQLLAFGDGSYDFGYDAGVVAHEFGHSIVQSTTDMLMDFILYDEYGVNNAPSGIHEGLADYWSGSYQQRSKVCGYIPLGRDMDNDKQCPGDLTGESHDDGEIVGAAMWDVYERVGKDAADDIVYGMLLTISDAPTFQELAEVVVATAEALADDGALTDDDVAAIEEAMHDRGMLACGRSLAIDPDERFEFELGLLMGFTELPGSMCETVREMGFWLTPSFQFAVTTPPAEDGEIEELELDLDLDRFDGLPMGADDLRYRFFVRADEMVTFDFEVIQSPQGWEMESPVPDGFDLEFDDNPDKIEITLDDDDIELRPDTTYYITAVHQNCVAVELTIETEFDLAPPPKAGDDDDDEGGCACGVAGDGPGSAAALALALAAILGMRRRR